jgi:hypothetical protein
MSRIRGYKLCGKRGAIGFIDA